MPDDPNITDETISLSEYKKLQRKYERRNKSASKLEEQVEGLYSSVARLEDLLLGVVSIVDVNDEQRPNLDKLLTDVGARRKSDVTSAQLQARLNQVLDDADADWEDERFDSARRLLEQINESGDLTRAYELERMVQDAITESSSPEDFEARVTEEVERRVQDQRREGARVDTRESSAADGRVSRRDLLFDPNRDSIEGLRERANKALEQITG